MSKQPKALTIADQLNYQVEYGSYDWERAETMMTKAADELIRLHNENKRLRSQEATK